MINDHQSRFIRSPQFWSIRVNIDILKYSPFPLQVPFKSHDLPQTMWLNCQLPHMNTVTNMTHFATILSLAQ